MIKAKFYVVKTNKANVHVKYLRFAPSLRGMNYPAVKRQTAKKPFAAGRGVPFRRRKLLKNPGKNGFPRTFSFAAAFKIRFRGGGKRTPAKSKRLLPLEIRRRQ